MTLNFLRVWTALVASSVVGQQFHVGPSFIPDAIAQGPRDITLSNEKIAFAISLETSPFGMPPGTLCDLSLKQADGSWHRSVTEFADFYPDQFTPWETSHLGIQLIQQGGGIALQVERGYATYVTVVVEYRLRPETSYVEVNATLHNSLGVTIQGLMPGWTVLTRSDKVLGVPGLEGLASGPVEGRAIANRSVQYGEDWVAAIHTDFDYFSREGRDLYSIVNIEPQQLLTFTADLQLEPISQFDEILTHKVPVSERASISGQVHQILNNYTASVVVGQRSQSDDDFHLLGWIEADNEGVYSAELPAGSYVLYADAEGHGPSTETELSLTAGESVTVDFNLQGGPGLLRLRIQGRSPAGLVTIRGAAATPFHPTRLVSSEDGSVEASLAPGRYTAEVSSGIRFHPSVIEFDIAPNAVFDTEVYMRPVIGSAWKFADLTHHTPWLRDELSFTESVKAQRAAGLDVVVTADHVTRHLPAIAEWCENSDTPCLFGCELIASWGSFVPLHINADSHIDGDVYTQNLDTLMELFDTEWNASALMISNANDLDDLVNKLEHLIHREDESNSDFDTSDVLSVTSDAVTSDVSSDVSSLNLLLSLNFEGNWSQVFEVAKKVWSEEAFRSALNLVVVGGHGRGFANVEASSDDKLTATAVFVDEETLTTQTFVDNLIAGRAYATSGPLIDTTDVVFGDVVNDGTLLKMTIASQAGIASVRLTAPAFEAEVPFTTVSDTQVSVQVTISSTLGSWVTFQVTDKAGAVAVTNPLWVTRIDTSSAATLFSTIIASIVITLLY